MEVIEQLAQGEERVDFGLMDLLSDRIENEAVLTVLDTLISPGLNILLILVLAALAAVVAKRLVQRAVASSKDPDSSRRGLKRRIGLAEGDPVSSTRRAQRADAVGALVGSVVSVVIWTLAVFMILGAVGIDLAPLLAGAGVVGLAIGFGAQDLVKDFLSGVFMLIEDQYGVGDIIDAGEAVGVVEGISLRSTRIRDVTGTLWHVPNGEISRIGNMSQQWARALLDVRVSYSADIDAASDLILRVAKQMAHEPTYERAFLDEPEIWGVQDLGADSVDIRLVIRTLPGEQWGITRELRRRIKMAFDEADVEIPFPQRTVWLRTEQPVAVGDDTVEAWSDGVPDAATRERAARLASATSTREGTAAGERVPDAEEASHGGGDPDEQG